jgi:nucleotide-binding universal stress UspA family protein
MLLSHTHHVGVNNIGEHAMKAQKFLHIRIPYDFHQQLVKYAEDRFVPVSSVVLQAVAKTIDYVPKKTTPRTPSPPLPFTPAPVVDAEEESVDFTDEELADLQRRASSAPIRPFP